jgi:hypothetical protein
MSAGKVLEFAAAVCAVAAMFAPGGEAAAADQPKAKVAHSVTFEAFRSSDLADLAPYAKMPEEKDAVPNKENPGVIEEVDWALRETLVPACVPDQKFVAENVRLVPAKRRREKEDVAFLSYEMGGKTFMVVQTGDVSGDIWVLIRPHAANKVNSAEDAAAGVRSVIDKCFTKRVRDRFPPPAFNNAGKIYVGKVMRKGRYDARPSPRGTFYVANAEFCLAFSKRKPHRRVSANCA